MKDSSIFTKYRNQSLYTLLVPYLVLYYSKLMKFVENKKIKIKKMIFRYIPIRFQLKKALNKKVGVRSFYSTLLSKESTRVSNAFYFCSFFKYNEIINERDERMDDEIIYIQSEREKKYD